MNRYNFRFGVNVYGANGHEEDKQVGHLAKVVVDPANWEVTNIVVESGLLFKRTTVIPLNQVKDASLEAVRLLIGKDEITDYPEFKQTIVERGVQGWAQPASGGSKFTATSTGVVTAAPEVEVVRERVRLGVDDDALVLDSKTEVNGLDGRVGHLGQIVTARETSQMKHLGVVANQSVLREQQFLIPVQLVERLGEQLIEVAATAEALTEFKAPS